MNSKLNSMSSKQLIISLARLQKNVFIFGLKNFDCATSCLLWCWWWWCVCISVWRVGCNLHTLGQWPGYYAAARADGSPLPSSGGRGRGTHLSSSYIRPPPSHQHQIMSSPDTPPISQYIWKRRSAKFSQPWRRPLHTPPKGGVRT